MILSSNRSEGYYKYGRLFHPYTIKLEGLLENHLSRKIEVFAISSILISRCTIGESQVTKQVEC